MQQKVFTVPLLGGDEANEELNRYLRGQRVVSVDKEFCEVGGVGYWMVAGQQHGSKSLPPIKDRLQVFIHPCDYSCTDEWKVTVGGTGGSMLKYRAINQERLR